MTNHAMLPQVSRGSFFEHRSFYICYNTFLQANLHANSEIHISATIYGCVMSSDLEQCLVS